MSLGRLARCAACTAEEALGSTLHAYLRVLLSRLLLFNFLISFSFGFFSPFTFVRLFVQFWSVQTDKIH